jgi:hypothetical protein
MDCRQLALVGALVLAPGVSRAQATDPVDHADSIALSVAVFRVAIVHGQLTAHGAAVPEVFCLAMARFGPSPTGERFGEPDSTVVARVSEKFSNARPMSACHVDPRSNATDHRSLVVERATERRGIVVWMEPPARDTTGALTVHIGFNENGLSAAYWICAIRRTAQEWVVNACRMIGIS